MLAKILAAPTTLPGQGMAGNPQNQVATSKVPLAAKPMVANNTGGGKTIVPRSKASGPRATAPLSFKPSFGSGVQFP